MKIAIRILTILAITVLVASGIYLLVENTSITNGLSADLEDGRPEFAEGDRAERPEGGEIGRAERSEGDHDHNQSASLAGDLAEMSGSIAKISVITAIILAIQFILTRFKKRATIRNLVT